jgi:hypothetical protein
MYLYQQPKLIWTIGFVRCRACFETLEGAFFFRISICNIQFGQSVY